MPPDPSFAATAAAAIARALDGRFPPRPLVVHAIGGQSHVEGSDALWADAAAALEARGCAGLEVLVAGFDMPDRVTASAELGRVAAAATTRIVRGA